MVSKMFWPSGLLWQRATATHMHCCSRIPSQSSISISSQIKIKKYTHNSTSNYLDSSHTTRQLARGFTAGSGGASPFPMRASISRSTSGRSATLSMA